MVKHSSLYRLMTRRVNILTFIVGFAIGAGILGLPTRFGSSGAGFLPSITMLIITLIFQIITAVYIIEGLDALGPSEYPELMRKSLGNLAWVLSYMFIILYLFGAMTAYIVFGGQAITTLSKEYIPLTESMIIYWLVGVLITIGGVKIIARAEGTMVAMIILLLILNVILCLATPYVNVENLLWGDWGKILSVFGVVLFAFSVHTAIPTAYRSFGLDEKYHRIVSLGLIVSAIIYSIWSASYMSILSPNDYHKTFVGALSGKIYHGISGLPAPIAVAELGKLKVAAIVGYVFGFFTTITSFVAASHSLYQINLELIRFKLQYKRYKLLALLPTIIPPLLLAVLRLGSFIDWLSFTGSIGAGVLTGILPCLLAIYLRIRKPKNWTPLMPGGIILALITLSFYILGITWYILYG